MPTGYPVPRYNSPSTGGWVAPATTVPRGAQRPNATAPRRRTASQINESSPRGRTRYAAQQRDQLKRRGDDRARLLAELQKALGASASGAGGAFGAVGGGAAAPTVPLEPVAPNRYEGVQGAIAAQTRDSQRYLASQGNAMRGQLAANGGGQLLEGGAGTFAEQLAQTLGATAAQSRSLQFGAQQAYASDELRRQGEQAKALYDQATKQYQANQESGGNLSISMIEALAGEGLDPGQFMGNPIAAAIALGRLRYARRGEAGGITPSMIAQAAQLGLDYRQFDSANALAEALGQARRGQYGSTDLAQQFLSFLNS